MTVLRSIASFLGAVVFEAGGGRLIRWGVETVAAGCGWAPPADADGTVGSAR